MHMTKKKKKNSKYFYAALNSIVVFKAESWKPFHYGWHEHLLKPMYHVHRSDLGLKYRHLKAEPQNESPF